MAQHLIVLLTVCLAAGLMTERMRRQVGCGPSLGPKIIQRSSLDIQVCKQQGMNKNIKMTASTFQPESSLSYP